MVQNLKMLVEDADRAGLTVEGLQERRAEFDKVQQQKMKEKTDGSLRRCPRSS
jgi:hypothetical protein